MRAHVIKLFVSHGEKQLVLDDRAAEVKAHGLVFERVAEYFPTAKSVAGQILIVIQVEGRAMELVRTRFGNYVDCTTRELAVLNIERRKLDGRRGDRIVRNRE